MSISFLTDTFLNIWVFAFLGILVWLYFKKESSNDENEIMKGR